MTFEEFLMWSILFVVVVLFALIVLMYLTESYIHYKVIKLFGTCNPWLGFVPFFGKFLLGRTCNGKDGYNIGVFGLSLPNWFWNFGWLVNYVSLVSLVFYNNYSSLSIIFTEALGVVVFVVSTLYYASIYAFIYSRVERKMEPDVRMLSIVSAVIGVVGFAKLLSIRRCQLYSLPNDVYPNDGDRPGGSYSSI